MIFGEQHERRPNLLFFNEVIPQAYHQAGVTCVAMEVCLAADNEALEQLVTAPAFDRDLALSIARHQPWGLWGWKEYWDVFETVWRVNHDLTQGAKKLRVIGLQEDMDMPSVALLGFEANAASEHCPVWEKLRIVRVPFLVPRVLAGDAFMAREIETQIIDKGERGIVWIGCAHATTRSPQVNPGGRSMSRMGYILRRRHGDAVFDIQTHHHDIPAREVDPGYTGPAPAMAKFLESVMKERSNAPVAFDTIDSPFASLRDGGSFEYHFDPRLTLADKASGYVFLVPREVLSRSQCRWMEGYVSEPMFLRNKPFYQAFGRKAGREFHNAQDLNALFATEGAK